MADSTMTHLPQLKSIRINVSKLILLLLLDCLLHTTPRFIALNLDWKNLVDIAADYPAEQRDDSFRHENLLTTVYSHLQGLITSSSHDVSESSHRAMCIS